MCYVLLLSSCLPLSVVDGTSLTVPVATYSAPRGCVDLAMVAVGHSGEAELAALAKSARVAPVAIKWMSCVDAQMSVHSVNMV